MATFNLYKKGRYGWFHVTSVRANSLKEAIEFYKDAFCIRIGNELMNYKVTGL